jgi:hypothetical protein
MGKSATVQNCPTQAKKRLEWATQKSMGLPAWATEGEYRSTRVCLQAYIFLATRPATRTRAKEEVNSMQYMISWNERPQGSPS